MASEKDLRVWQRIVAEAWADERFRRRLIADPKAVLAEYGIKIEKGVEVRVVDDSERVRHLVLPCKPKGEHEKEVLERYVPLLCTKIA